MNDLNIKHGDIGPQAVTPKVGYVYDALPQSLRDPSVKQFLLFKLQPKPNEPNKFDKLPYYIDGSMRSGIQGSDEDRSRLAPFNASNTYPSEHEDSP